MSITVQIRRGNTAQHSAFTGANAELTYNTDQKVVVAHDGINAGGTYLVSNNQLQANIQYFVNTSQISSNLSNYVTTTNLSNNLANYQTTAGLSANVALLAANSATYLGNSSGTITNIDSWITTNAAAAYTNAVSYTDTKIGTANSAITGNAATAYTNAVSYTDTKIGTANLAITGNAATAYTNAVSYVDGKLYVNTSQLSNNLSNYALLSGATFTGNTVFNNNILISAGANVYANGALGSAGQALTTNGSSVYWSTIVGTNTAALYTWTNNHTYNANVTIAATGELIITAGAGIYANGSLGTANQILTSNGSSIYWATAGGGGATLTANSTDTQTFYIPMANTTTGTWSNAVVSTAKLYFVPSTGTLSATIFNSLSDETQKTDIQTINNALDIVSDLRGVRFTWKETGESSTGVIAQEVEKVLPELVTNKDGLKSVNYDGLIGVLIESIKELKEEIRFLKQEKYK